MFTVLRLGRRAASYATTAAAAARPRPSPPRPPRLPRRWTVGPSGEAVRVQLDGIRIEEADADAAGASAYVIKSLDGEPFDVNKPGFDRYFHTPAKTMQFLGTGSMYPTEKRGSSSLVLRLDGESWMFDCGEASFRQLTRTPIDLPTVKRIFITHLHGDHIFGLPSMLTGLGQARRASLTRLGVWKDLKRDMYAETTYTDLGDDELLEVIGPVGLRAYLRGNAKVAAAMIGPYVVHELEGMPSFYTSGAKKGDERPYRAASRVQADANFPAWWYGEIAGGEQIPRDADGFWTVLSDSMQGMRVRAGPVNHGNMPCVGYTLTHSGSLGKNVDAEKVESELLTGADNNSLRGKVYSALKLTEGPVILPDGRVVSRCADYLEKKEKQKEENKDFKLCILGDTGNARPMLPLLKDADVLVHECTTVPFPWDLKPRKGQGKPSKANYKNWQEMMERRIIDRGHSTARAAGLLAKEAGARLLVLNHFSQSITQFRQFKYLQRQASNASGLPIGNVLCAQDFLSLLFQQQKDKPIGQNYLLMSPMPDKKWNPAEAHLHVPMFSGPGDADAQFVHPSRYA